MRSERWTRGHYRLVAPDDLSREEVERYRRRSGF